MGTGPARSYIRSEPLLRALLDGELISPVAMPPCGTRCGRQVALSFNPYRPGPGTGDSVVDVFTAAYCPPAG